MSGNLGPSSIVLDEHIPSSPPSPLFHSLQASLWVLLFSALTLPLHFYYLPLSSHDLISYFLLQVLTRLTSHDFHHSVIRHHEAEVGVCPAPSPCHCFLIRLLSSQWFSLWEMDAKHPDNWTEHPPKYLQRVISSSLSFMLSCHDAETGPGL